MYYNQILKYCKKYNINVYCENGKKLTYNKLRHIVNNHTNKKHKLSQKQKIYNNILKYLEDDIDENELSNAMHHYIGN